MNFKVHLGCVSTTHVVESNRWALSIFHIIFFWKINFTFNEKNNYAFISDDDSSTSGMNLKIHNLYRLYILLQKNPEGNIKHRDKWRVLKNFQFGESWGNERIFSFWNEMEIIHFMVKIKCYRSNSVHIVTSFKILNNVAVCTPLNPWDKIWTTKWTNGEDPILSKLPFV